MGVYTFVLVGNYRYSLKQTVLLYHLLRIKRKKILRVVRRDVRRDSRNDTFS